MRLCEMQKLLWSASLEPSPLPVISSAVLAPDHEDECPLIADASHLWCHSARATVAAVEPLVGHRTEALEKCVTHLLIGESEMRKHLSLTEKVK